MRKYIPAVWIVLTLAAAALAQEPVALIDPGKPAGGWVFDNGREFPGARGNSNWRRSPFAASRC